MKALLLSPVFLVAVLQCPQLEADSFFPDCVAGSLQSYIVSSACVLGGGAGGEVVFSGFTFPNPLNPDGAITVLDASQIELTPVSSGLGGSFDISGISGGFSVPAGDTVTYDIDYFLQVDPGQILGGGSLTLDPSGDVSVTESICADSLFGTGSGGATVCQANTPGGVVDSALQSLSVNDSDPSHSLSAQIALNPEAYSFASVETEIVLTGGTAGASFGGVVIADTVVATAPEPSFTLLFLVSLSSVMVLLRRLLVPSR